MSHMARIMISKFLFTYIVLFVNYSCVYGAFQQRDTGIAQLRDSLNQITYQIPEYSNRPFERIIYIRDQTDWGKLSKTLADELKRGARSIELRVTGKQLVLPVKANSILGLYYPDARVRIVGDKSQFVAEGRVFKRRSRESIREGDFWVAPYEGFDINDIIIDNKGREIDIKSEVKECTTPLEYYKQKGDDVWRMRTSLPDMDENKCSDFYILITRDWTSARHKVLKVCDGWLYFHLDSEDLHSERDPNIDNKLYGISIRYRLINSPFSKGVHITDGMLYVPKRYKSIRINKGGYLLHMNNCVFNYFEIKGFKLSGLSQCPIGIYNSTFNTGLFVHHNTFTYLSGLAFSTVNCNNICFSDNIISNSRSRTLGFSGTNFTICRNHLKNIGWMSNTAAIAAGGENLHICDNVIEDFNYSAINCGTRSAIRDGIKLTYIIERNLIRLDKEYTKYYYHNTLADGGAIYIGPSCTQGIIRYNVIQDIKGVNGNRGIFLDDGCKNLAIYGNLIVNTENYYDIDLRLVKTLEKDIPDHNTNNSVFYNIMTGGYRFEDTGENSNCVGGENFLLGVGHYQKITIDLYQRAEDFNIEGCSISKENKAIIPKQYSKLLDDMSVDPFVYKYIVVK